MEWNLEPLFEDDRSFCIGVYKNDFLLFEPTLSYTTTFFIYFDGVYVRATIRGKLEGEDSVKEINKDMDNWRAAILAANK